MTATSTFEVGEGGAAIASIALEVEATVSGMDESTFREAAEGAKENCPVSKALKGNVEISLRARLMA